MRFTLVVGSVVLFYGANVLAQVGVVDNPFSAGAEVAKIGLGVASFLALIWFLKWLAGENKASRADFLAANAALQKVFADEMRLLREHNERQVVRLHEAISEIDVGKKR